MKIVALQAENIKKLKAVEIRPNGNLVEITGRNGQGKTSVLDSIWWALAGTDHIQVQPIRKGAEEARIRLDLGELIVTRTFKEGKTSVIKVENAEGAKYPTPQTMLDGLVGALSFDPLAFARMSPREQFDALRRFVPDVDFDAIEMQQRGDYDRRTARNRAAKEARTLLAAIPAAAAGEPAESISVDELVVKLDRAGNHNTDIETRKANREKHQARITSHRDVAAKGREEAVALRQRADALDTEAKRLEDQANEFTNQLAVAGELPTPIDTAGIRAEISEAQEHNRRVEEVRAREARRAEQLRIAQVSEQEAEQITAAMAAREADKQAAIAAAKLPVPGMSFGVGAVLLEGVPFEQASDAEQLRASIAIAMAANPKLRVLRVRDGSLLDETSLQLLEDMANANDFQVWIERVDSSGKVGFVLEDGHVRVAGETPAEAAA